MTNLTTDSSRPGVPYLFPLNASGGGENLIRLLDTPFDPKGDWTQTFAHYTTAAKASRVGQFTLSRKRNPTTQRIRYTFVQSKKHVNGEQHIEAEILTRDDATATPLRYSMKAWVNNAQGKPIDYTTVEKQAEFQAGDNGSTTLKLTDHLGTTVAEFNCPAIMSWLLFDVVQRLEGAAQKPVDFTLIDHFDQVKPEHRLTYRGTIDAPIRQQNVTLTGYDQVGRGVLPTVWYVDPNHRLVAVVSGIELFLLEPNRE